MDFSGKNILKLEVLDIESEAKHFHQDIELLYVLEGSMEVVIGDVVTQMGTEDVLIVNSNKNHCINGTEDILYMKLTIPYQTISDVFQSMEIIFWCDSTKEKSERYDELRTQLKILLNHYLENHGHIVNFGHIALCFHIIDIITKYFIVHTVDKESGNDKEQFEKRIGQINNYIRVNYNQPISLKDLSEKLFLSTGYLSRFFKKTYGMNFSEYLTNIRLHHAVEELLYSSAPVTRIALDNGFASVAIFNQVFKKMYGDTPSVYRKKSKLQKTADTKTFESEEIENRLKVIFNTSSIQKEKSESEEQEEIVSVNNVIPMENYWGNTINIGSAIDLLRSEVQQDLVTIKKALSFKYVRFWNPFKKEMLINWEAEEDNYNFNRLDSIIDFILQLGMKPHIELGAKPRQLTYNVQNIIYEDDKDAQFMGMERWERLLNAMMRHFLRRYGKVEIGTWRIELWFQETKWEKPGANEKYYELFDRTYEIIKSYSEQLEIGGCGLRLDFKPESRRMFAENWKSCKYHPDFMSIVFFPYIRGEIYQDKYAKRSTDDDCMKHWIAAERRMFEELGIHHNKLYITEWNITASARNYINDSCFKGAYIIKNVLDMYGLADDMGYYIGSDRISEYYDSNMMLHGGSGLISKQGIAKPAGYAFDFLQRLYPYFVKKGKNYMITTDEHHSYGIVYHNQQVLNYHYYFIKEDEVERDNLWNYYEGRRELNLTLQLEDMKDGEYQVKVYQINEQNGSLLDMWKEMDYEMEPSRNDLQYLKRVCAPKLSIYKKLISNGKLELHLNMKPNEIGFVRVRLLE